MKQEIKLHPFKDNSSELDLKISLAEKDHHFSVSFSFPLFNNTNKDLSKSKSQWGLWNHDVFELFVQKRKQSDEAHLPYTEFQISPLGQFFILEILKKRELYYSPLSCPFSFQTKTTDSWLGTIEFPKERDFDYYFNFTAIQGPLANRNHYASCGDFKSPADFHCPQLFKKYF